MNAQFSLSQDQQALLDHADRFGREQFAAVEFTGYVHSMFTVGRVYALTLPSFAEEGRY